MEGLPKRGRADAPRTDPLATRPRTRVADGRRIGGKGGPPADLTRALSAAMSGLRCLRSARHCPRLRSAMRATVRVDVWSVDVCVARHCPSPCLVCRRMCLCLWWALSTSLFSFRLSFRVFPPPRAYLPSIRLLSAKEGGVPSGPCPESLSALRQGRKRPRITIAVSVLVLEISLC